MERLIIATHNQGKVREIRELFAGSMYEVFSLADLNLDVDVVEDGLTFEQNALKKAVEIQAITGGTVLADDSGLEVDALGGKPGIHSARYGGPGLTDAQRTEKLLSELEGVPEDQRQARFVCVAAIVSPQQRFALRGTLDGMIARTPRGENGFGYDPVFFLPEYDKTVAELDGGTKNSISHRGRAMRRVREALLNGEANPG